MNLEDFVDLEDFEDFKGYGNEQQPDELSLSQQLFGQQILDQQGQ
jgi:hypothetical protein